MLPTVLPVLLFSLQHHIPSGVTYRGKHGSSTEINECQFHLR